MRRYHKWLVALGIAAATPGVTQAGMWPFASSKTAAPAANQADTKGKRTNQQVADDIAKALRAAELHGYKIEVMFQNGVATLSGSVTSPELRETATKVVSKVQGVQAVSNKLSVAPKPKTQAAAEKAPAQTASTRTAPSKTAVRQASATTSNKGKIQRTQHEAFDEKEEGLMEENEFSQNRELAAAEQAQGEQPVFTGEDAAQARAANQQVANAITNALRAANFQGNNVEIIFKDGVAVLGGTVATAEYRAAATAIVSQVAGVQRVENQLAVAGQTQPMTAAAGGAETNNQQMANAIGQALKSANFRGYDIEILYKDGVAVLNGSVASPDQKAAASGIVSQVSGIQRVDNRLMVGGPAQAPPMMGQPPMMAQNPGMRMAQGPGPGPGPMPPGPGGYGHPAGMASQAAFDQPNLPDHAWPSYGTYPNYAQVNYPKQYSASAWPYIGPFYPYPQIPLGWRAAQLEWDDGYWNLNFRPRTDRWWWFLDYHNW